MRYHKDQTRSRVYRYRRNFPDEQLRPTWQAGKEYLVVSQKYRDGKIQEVGRYRVRYYKLKQRPLEGKMP